MTIGIAGLAKSYGARPLFEGVSLQLNEGSRYGLVGANGAGKTTLMRLLAGDEAPTEGSVSIPSGARVGVLRQDHFMRDDERIVDVAMQGDRIVWEALAEQRALAHDGEANDRDDARAQRIVDLEEIIAIHDGYTLEARASSVLQGLGIAATLHAMPLATLSGGFKLRVLLAQVLLGGPDVVLLDEPTNHLDILSIRWLEGFLAAYRGCAVVISHDRRFLDAIATHILDVDYGTVTEYVGDFTSFERLKAEARGRQEAVIERKKEVIADKRAFVERFGAKATKASQAQSRVKQIEKIEADLEELATSNRRRPRFRFEPRRPSGKDVLAIEELSKSFGEKHVLRGVSLTIRRGERVAVIGANGLGKSTLLKIATGRLEPNEGAGEVTWGHETHVGYFAQDHRELLPDPEATPLDTIWNLVPKEATTFVRGELGRALFSGEDVNKKVGSLSGGESARLVFCRLMVERPNVLVLDEPTNHLDLEAIDALADALAAFSKQDGTLVFVSHDRHFVGRLATRIVEVTADGFRDFLGTYDEWLEREGSDHLDVETVILKAKEQKRETDKTLPNGASWAEQKKQRNRLKDLPKRRDQLLARIEAGEARRKAIAGAWASPGFYERTSTADVTTMQKEDDTLRESLEGWIQEWESLEAQIAALS